MRYYSRRAARYTPTAPKRSTLPRHAVVEGPVPADVWQASKTVHSGGWSEREQGYSAHIVQHPSGGLYLMQCGFMGGWTFVPVVVEEV